MRQSSCMCAHMHKFASVCLDHSLWLRGHLLMARQHERHRAAVFELIHMLASHH